MRSLLCASVIALLSACGGGGPTDNDDIDGFDGFTARIDGAPWKASAALSAVNNEPGRYYISAARTTGANNYTLTFTLNNIPGPGTYPLGVGLSMFGGEVTVSQPGDSWTTPFTGDAGQIVITTLTPTRIVGTFQFVTEADAGTTGTRTVTEGLFDIAVVQAGGVAAANMGSSFTAAAGTPFNAAQVTYVLASGNLMIVAQSETRTVTISIMNMTGTGLYPLSTSVPLRTILLGTTGGGWTSATTSGSGSVSLTASADRFSGTFEASLIGPSGGGPPTLVTINGIFSIGRAAP